LLTLPTKIMTARNIRRGMLWWKMWHRPRHRWTVRWPIYGDS
jgi:hypothetical protein